MCVLCPHDPIACRPSRFDVLLSVFFTHRLFLDFYVRSWMSSVLKQLFFVLYELRFVFTSSCVACKVCNTWSNEMQWR